MDIDIGSTAYIMGNRKYWHNETMIARRLAQKYYWLYQSLKVSELVYIKQLEADNARLKAERDELELAGRVLLGLTKRDLCTWMIGLEKK